MKITVEPKQKQESKEVPYDDIEPGMVYQNSWGVTLLKLEWGNAVLLLHSDGSSEWFAEAMGSVNKPAIKILGRIKEIIVEEI